MIVFKLSWAPWILIAAGILVAMNDPAGLVLTVAGIVWLVLRVRHQKGTTGNGISSGAAQGTKTNTVKPQRTNPSKTTGMHYCPHCGKPIESDFTFCSNCGGKLHIK